MIYNLNPSFNFHDSVRYTINPSQPYHNPILAFERYQSIDRFFFFFKQILYFIWLSTTILYTLATQTLHTVAPIKRTTLILTIRTDPTRLSHLSPFVSDGLKYPYTYLLLCLIVISSTHLIVPHINKIHLSIVIYLLMKFIGY